MLASDTWGPGQRQQKLGDKWGWAASAGPGPGPGRYAGQAQSRQPIQEVSGPQDRRERAGIISSCWGYGSIPQGPDLKQGVKSWDQFPSQGPQGTGTYVADSPFGHGSTVMLGALSRISPQPLPQAVSKANLSTSSSLMPCQPQTRQPVYQVSFLEASSTQVPKLTNLPRAPSSCPMTELLAQHSRLPLLASTLPLLPHLLPTLTHPCSSTEPLPFPTLPLPTSSLLPGWPPSLKCPFKNPPVKPFRFQKKCFFPLKPSLPPNSHCHPNATESPTPEPLSTLRCEHDQL